jgi:hypothetical protein
VPAHATPAPGADYLYFVVVRGGLELFNCRVDASGIAHLNTEPTITCGSGPYTAMVPYGVLSLLFYGLGTPLMFGLVLWRHREPMRRDVAMLAAGRGDNALENPDYWVRRRYSRLYSDYEPECVVLLLLLLLLLLLFLFLLFLLLRLLLSLLLLLRRGGGGGGGAC